MLDVEKHDGPVWKSFRDEFRDRVLAVRKPPRAREVCLTASTLLQADVDDREPKSGRFDVRVLACPRPEGRRCVTRRVEVETDEAVWTLRCPGSNCGIAGIAAGIKPRPIDSKRSHAAAL